MSSTTVPRVDYVASARRHLKDAHILQHAGRRANAGQLFGFSVECGLKAALVKAGVAKDNDGNITKASGMREHLPKLGQLVVAAGAFPDGRYATVVNGHLQNLAALTDWHTDHRYWRLQGIPLTSRLDQWELAALEVDGLLDDLNSRGLL